MHQPSSRCYGYGLRKDESAKCTFRSSWLGPSCPMPCAASRFMQTFKICRRASSAAGIKEYTGMAELYPKPVLSGFKPVLSGLRQACDVATKERAYRRVDLQ